MAASQSSTRELVKGARAKIEAYDFGVLTAGELQNRIEAGDSDPRDVSAMLADVHAILDGRRGEAARSGFTDELLKVAARNVTPASSTRPSLHTYTVLHPGGDVQRRSPQRAAIAERRKRDERSGLLEAIRQGLP